MATLMSRRKFLQAAGASALLALAPHELIHAKASPSSMVWTATGHAYPELAAYDNNLKTFMLARNIPGAALAVTRNGKLMLARGYTYIDSSNTDDLIVQPDSLFRIASIAKPFTATAILRLVQDGSLSLSAKLSSLLTLTPPAGHSMDARLTNITVRNLLQHLGGWDRSLAPDPMFLDNTIHNALSVSMPISSSNIVTYMNGQPLQHDPGTIYAYSNYGYCLLGKIIEAVSGKSYVNYINQAVFAPLSITRMKEGRTLLANRLPNEVKYHSQYVGSTVFYNVGASVPAPYGAWNLENMQYDGGWLASAVDLVRFASAFDKPASSPILSSASITTMFGLPENIPPASYITGDFYYACGWAVRDYGPLGKNTWHDGSLDGTYALMVRRNDGLNWAVFFNQGDDPSGLAYPDIDGLLHTIADSITTWPSHDLFPEYFRKTYLPMIGR